jgi:hypothetical protein
MHHYISIPALDHKIFKYQGFVNPAPTSLLEPPFLGLLFDDYMGDRIDEHGNSYKPLHTPKKIILTKRAGDSVKAILWSNVSRPGAEKRAMVFAMENDCMLHCFQVDDTSAMAKALDQHIEIEQHQADLSGDNHET